MIEIPPEEDALNEVVAVPDGDAAVPQNLKLWLAFVSDHFQSLSETLNSDIQQWTTWLTIWKGNAEI